MLTYGSPVEGLLVRMRGGDREAAAEFIERYGPRLRWRVRSRLSPAMRRIYDSQDVLSTVARRLDMLVAERRLRAESEPQFWALIRRVTENAVVDRARIMKRLHEVEDEDGDFARLLMSRLSDHTPADSTTDIELHTLIDSIVDDIDRQILVLWLHEVALKDIAISVNLEAGAVRSRWHRIRQQMQHVMEHSA